MQRLDRYILVRDFPRVPHPVGLAAAWSVLIGAMLVGHPAAAGDVEDGLIGHWPLVDPNSSEVAEDHSGHGQHGAIRGAELADDGRGGRALLFDGKRDCVSIPADAFAPIDQAFSIELQALGGPGNSFTFQGWNGDGVRTVGCSMPWSSGMVYFDFGTGCCDHRVGYHVAEDRTWREDDWNHWVVTRDAATGHAAIYCNGRLTAETRHDCAVPAVASFFIGGFDGKGAYGYNGMIRQVRLYRRALAAPEVTARYFAATGYRARLPWPADRARPAGMPSLLEWYGHPGADSYYVYLGSDGGGLERVGDGIHASFRPAEPLDHQTDYRWRVDTVVGDRIVEGTTWSFRTGPPPPDPDLLGFDELLVVKRRPYSSDHNYTVVNNGTSADRFTPENGIYRHHLRTGQTRPVITAAELPRGAGVIGKFSLSYDATRVVFDYRPDVASGFRIWEVGVDGGGLRQLTFAPEDEAAKLGNYGNPAFHTDDMHPCYLPDGGIVFTSSRCEHGILCGGQPGLVAVILHRMDADGGNLRRLTSSPVSEFSPVVLPDGRVMYHRWEYVDKGARVGKTFWAMAPDGTRSEELFGLSDSYRATGAHMYPMPVPGNDQLIACVSSPHYPQGNSSGPILMIDLGRDARTEAPMINITPAVRVGPEQNGWLFAHDEFARLHPDGVGGPLYTHPYPLNENQVLVSYKHDPADHYRDVPGAYAIYLIDREGNEALVYRDEDDSLSCWHPTPLAPRPVPMDLASAANPDLAAQGRALCLVVDVYQGMEDVEPGSVKYLRINEAVPRSWSSRKRWQKNYQSNAWIAALWPRVQWGIVPVEADGSAHFTVPADRNIFFQALDADFQELQRERTYVNYRPGEVRSCIGCHDRSRKVVHPRPGGGLLALQRAPSVPRPQPGEADARQVIHYPSDIQPLFDAACVSCHGADRQDGGLNLAGTVTDRYSTSYEELVRKESAGPVIAEFISQSGRDDANVNGSYLPPKTLGSYRSPLIHILRTTDAEDPHYRLLDPVEFRALIRWVDSNYQFYGTYFGRHHGAHKDHPAFRRKPTFAEAISPNAPEWHR